MTSSSAPTVENIARGLGVIFPDLPEDVRMWSAGLMLDTMSGSSELADELFYVKLEQAVRAGNENAIHMVVAAARRGLKI